uniref:Putative secreted protein n=1 Tax=Ixodes scapularis TaxID=6945 RepID=A0A4D5RXE3_IXOSC
MLRALCNALGACATSRGSAFHGPVTSWEVLHGGDDILSSTSFTIWDQVHEGSHCKQMKGGHCDLEVKLVHLPLQS